MFAAAAIVAQTLFNVAIQAAKWLATKAFVVAVLALVLPWVLRGVLYWAFNYLAVYGHQLSSSLFSYISDFISTNSSGVVVDIELTGVGGYLAQQTGVVEYASIIFTGWGLYWVIAILAKTPTKL